MNLYFTSGLWVDEQGVERRVNIVSHKDGDTLALAALNDPAVVDLLVTYCDKATQGQQPAAWLNGVPVPLPTWAQ